MLRFDWVIFRRNRSLEVPIIDQQSIASSRCLQDALHRGSEVGMSRKVFFCIPVPAAAILSAIAIIVIFTLGSASGWHWIYVAHSISGYARYSVRIKAFAGVLGSLALIVACVSCYGLFAIITKRRLSVQYYLWSSWLTFFVACIAVSAFCLLLWMDDAWTSLAAKIISTIIAALGLFVQLYLTVVLRLYYEQLQHERVRDTEDPFATKYPPGHPNHRSDDEFTT